MRRLALKLYGTAPAPDAPKLDQLRYVRRIYLRTLWGPAAVAVGAIAAHSTFVWVLLIISAVSWVIGLANVERGIRREQRS